MSLTYKMISQGFLPLITLPGDAATTYWTVGYEVPKNKACVITSIIFRENAGINNGFIDMILWDSATYPGQQTNLINVDKQFILFKNPIGPDETKTFKSWMSLEYGQSILLRSVNNTSTLEPGSTFINFFIFGNEYTNLRQAQQSLV